MPDNKEEKILIDKKVFPTALRSDEIRIFWSKALKEKALFSARTTTKEYLEKVKQALVDYEKGISETEEGLPISQGLERTRTLMAEKLNELGLIERDENGNTVEGKMTNLGSTMRLNLIVKTNTALAHSMQQKMSAQDPLQKILRPAFELYRGESRKTQRNWWDMWNIAADRVNWEGVVRGTTRMIALTTSPIWSELGNGFPDSIGTDTPPFWWNSGGRWRTVTRKELTEAGLEIPE